MCFKTCFLLYAIVPLIACGSSCDTRCWKILEEESRSFFWTNRSLAYTAAGMTHRTEGVLLLQKALSDPHHLIRNLAVVLAQNQRDYLLKQEILKRLKIEKNPSVRLALIRSIGPMGNREGVELLSHILESSKVIQEEKDAALLSLLSLYASPTKKELQALLDSSSPFLRELGCRLNWGAIDLAPYFNDDYTQVRVAALVAAAKYAPPKKEVVAIHLYDSEPQVALAAAIIAIKNAMGIGENEVMRNFLSHQKDQVRRLAVAACVACGNKGLSLQCLSNDPVVEMNFSLARLYERVDTDLLYHLKKHSVHWEEDFGVKVLALGNREDGCKMQLAQILITLGIEGAEELLIQELFRPSGHAPWIAAEKYLLSFGEKGVETIKKRMAAGGMRAQVEGHILLALWGAVESRLQLMTLYPSCDRKGQQKILEALGQMREQAALPLIEQELSSPFPSLKLRAAWAYIACTQ